MNDGEHLTLDKLVLIMDSTFNSTSAQSNRLYASAAELADRFAVGRSAIWGWLRSDPNFPKPVKLSPGTTRWKLSDIEAWETTRGQAVQS